MTNARIAAILRRILAILGLLAGVASPAGAQQVLTVAQTAHPLTFFLAASSDHITGLTGASPTVTLSKDGATFASPAGAVTEIGNGWYKVAGNASDEGTDGVLILHATAASADPSDARFLILDANVYDTVRLGLSALPNAAAGAAGGAQINGANSGATTYAGSVQYTGGVSMVSSAGSGLTVGTTAAGYPGLDTYGNGSGAGALLQGGVTGAGLSATGGTTSGDGIVAAAAGPSGNGIKATGAGTGKYDLAATTTTLAVASVTGAVGSVTGSVNSVTGSVGSVTGAVGSVTGSVGSIASGGITSASIASGAITSSTFATGALASVWDIATSSHTTAGTFGQLVGVALPDFAPGTGGGILIDGTNIATLNLTGSPGIKIDASGTSSQALQILGNASASAVEIDGASAFFGTLPPTVHIVGASGGGGSGVAGAAVSIVGGASSNMNAGAPAIAIAGGANSSTGPAGAGETIATGTGSSSTAVAALALSVATTNGNALTLTHAGAGVDLGATSTTLTLPAQTFSTTGSVGSVTGAVGSISGVSFPTNFSILSIDASGRCTLTPTEETNIATAVLGSTVETTGASITLAQAQRLALAILTGQSAGYTGSGGATTHWYAPDGTTSRMDITIDSNGNRTAVTRHP